MSLDIGNTIGDYQIVGILGAGGMGKVYKVRNIISDRIEAMKVLLPNLDSDQELAERFMREIKVQASLQHPNIASLHTALRVDNQLLMIMEFVEGSTIESIMQQRRIPLRDCIDYASQLLSALSYAHTHGVVHRDIKPPNMMLTPEGIIKLMDFGIAKISVDHRLTQTGKTVGSLFYMSPEQIRGSDVDARSDLYSLGISLYEMVTGRRPFEGESDYSIMAAHLQQPPQPPVQFDSSVPQALNDAIMISIAKDPAQRFQTAAAFRSALQSVEKDIGVGALAAANAGATQLYPAAPPPPPPPGRPRAATTVEPPPPAPRPSQPHIPSMGPSMAPPMPNIPPPHQYQPQYTPMAAPPAQSSGGHRGLYMVLGSIVTIGILVAAGLYLPKLWKTSASGSPTRTTQTQTTPQPAPIITPQPAPVITPAPAPAPVVSETTTPVNPVPTPKPAPVKQEPVVQHAEKPVVQKPAPVIVAQQPEIRPAPLQNPPQAMPQPNAPPAGNPVNNEMEELNHHKMLMHARIDAINNSMKNLEQEQRRQGLSLNGALVASQHRMVFFMETADGAMRKGNIAEARSALNNAERELDKLEEHFGR